MIVTENLVLVASDVKFYQRSGNILSIGYVDNKHSIILHI